MKKKYIATSPTSNLFFDFMMGMGVFTIVLALLLAVSSDAWSIQHALDAHASQSQQAQSHQAQNLLSLSDRHLAIVAMALMFSMITVVVKRSTKHLHQAFAMSRRKTWGRR